MCICMLKIKYWKQAAIPQPNSACSKMHIVHLISWQEWETISRIQIRTLANNWEIQVKAHLVFAYSVRISDKRVQSRTVQIRNSQGLGGSIAERYWRRITRWRPTRQWRCSGTTSGRRSLKKNLGWLSWSVVVVVVVVATGHSIPWPAICCWFTYSKAFTDSKMQSSIAVTSGNQNGMSCYVTWSHQIK